MNVGSIKCALQHTASHAGAAVGQVLGQRGSG